MSTSTSLSEVIRALKASNDRLASHVVGIRTPPPPKPPQCECGAIKRPFAPCCPDCEAKGGHR